MEGESNESGAWAPSTGTIVLDNLGCRYRDDLPQVLQGVCATLQSGSNVGVVGRTGAGKSSLAAALFRLTPLSGGAVLVDGVDVSPGGEEEDRDVAAQLE